MYLAQWVEGFSRLIGWTLTLLYLYQVGYLVVGLFTDARAGAEGPVPLGRYAVLISARNEAEVIGQLIRSLKEQDYPAELLDIYVVADNCTDATAEVARRAGATVFRRFDRRAVGKGYALDFLVKKLLEGGGAEDYEGYFIFDADNLVDPGFVREMNKTFHRGEYAAVTCYRNSKNFGENWISAGYSIWFLREARFLNQPRQALGLTCHVSGTGFLLSAQVVKEEGGWPFHLLTEDIQLSAQCAARGRRIGYCGQAMVYDEQPTDLRQSWDQRLRWSKGFYQVGARYAPDLLRGMCKGGRRGFGCYDILMLLAPGVLLSLLGGALHVAALLACLAAPEVLVAKVILAGLVRTLGGALLAFYRGMLLYGVLVVLCEWRSIKATAWQKLCYLPLFPIFMLTYLPISVCALFQKVEWKPIAHRAVAQLDRAA